MEQLSVGGKVTEAWRGRRGSGQRAAHRRGVPEPTITLAKEQNTNLHNWQCCEEFRNSYWLFDFLQEKRSGYPRLYMLTAQDIMEYLQGVFFLGKIIKQTNKKNRW